ncbi:hypothetical protein SEA_DUMPTRUCK_48 [Gordonia phage DumpTruck]|nr:hypothetical protein SEA_DUMPTRUCK_48 [Gordonia phage DumpTruck]
MEYTFTTHVDGTDGRRGLQLTTSGGHTIAIMEGKAGDHDLVLQTQGGAQIVVNNNIHEGHRVNLSTVVSYKKMEVVYGTTDHHELAGESFDQMELEVKYDG